jgi:hypothetical protein
VKALRTTRSTLADPDRGSVGAVLDSLVALLDHSVTVHVGLILLCALPCLLVRYLPFCDLPEHVAMSTILNHLNDPAWHFASYYAVDYTTSPYILVFLVGRGLLHVLSPFGTMRVLGFLAVAGPGLASLALLRALRLPLVFNLMVLPVLYNTAVYWGFVNFSLSITLALLTLACLFSRMRESRRAPLTAVAALGCVFAHSFGPLLLATVCGFYCLSSLRTAWRRVLPIIPALAAATAWSSLVTSSIPPGTPLLVGGLPGAAVARLLEIPYRILFSIPDLTAALLINAYLATVGGLMIGAICRRHRLASEGRAVRIALAGGCLACLAGYLVVAENAGLVYHIHFRFLMLLIFLLPAALASFTPTRAGRGLAVWMLALGVSGALLHGQHLAAFDREAREFDPVLEAIPRGQRYLLVNFTPDGAHGRIFQHDCYTHFAAIVQAAKGGLPAITFPRMFPHYPVRFREESRVPPVDPGIQSTQDAYDERAFGWAFPFLILHMSEGRGLAGVDRSRLDLRVHSGDWELWQRRPARVSLTSLTAPKSAAGRP